MLLNLVLAAWIELEIWNVGIGIAGDDKVWNKEMVLAIGSLLEGLRFGGSA